MVRKVIAGKDLMRAAGTVTKKLAAWLAEKGYAGAEEAEDASERGGEEDEVEDHFTLTRVECGRVWLEGMLDGRELGPIAVPEVISSRCKVGWTISGVVGRPGKWRQPFFAHDFSATVQAGGNAQEDLSPRHVRTSGTRPSGSRVPSLARSRSSRWPTTSSPTEAAGELLQEAVDPFMEDMKRQMELGLGAEANEHVPEWGDLIARALERP